MRTKTIPITFHFATWFRHRNSQGNSILFNLHLKLTYNWRQEKDAFNLSTSCFMVCSIIARHILKYFCIWCGVFISWCGNRIDSKKQMACLKFLNCLLRSMNVVLLNATVLHVQSIYFCLHSMRGKNILFLALKGWKESRDKYF